MSQVTPTADATADDAPLFAIPDYRRGWLLGLLSGIVRWLEFLALGVFAYQLTESPPLVDRGGGFRSVRYPVCADRAQTALSSVR